MYKLAADYGNVDFYNHIEFNYSNPDTIAEAQPDISNTSTTENYDSNKNNSDINTDSNFIISNKAKRNIGIGVAIAVAICIFCLIGSCSDKNTTPSYTEPTTTITTTAPKTDSRSLDECPVKILNANIEEYGKFDGINLSIQCCYETQQEVDKVIFFAAPFNSSGEVFDTIKMFTLEGPLVYGDIETSVFKLAWLSDEVKSVGIFAVHIYYSENDVVEHYLSPGYIMTNKLTKY